MKYKLQLILTALGILLTTVCHAQIAGTVISTHSYNFAQWQRGGSLGPVTEQTFRSARLPCWEVNVLNATSGAAIETMRFDEYKFYQGTNVALICNSKVGFYVLLGSF